MDSFSQVSTAGELMRWGVWFSTFEEGQYQDGWHNGQRAARVVACRKLAGIRVAPHRSGRGRCLYLALALIGDVWQVVGVYGSATKAKRECEWAVQGAAQVADPPPPVPPSDE